MSVTASPIPVQINASRVCQAISKIGYSPVSAIKDIIDNAVTASASSVLVVLELAEGKQTSNRNSVGKFSIIDNGCGMSDDEVVSAFELGSGSYGGYAPNSLSKYGLGLKSAGLSLGDRITVLSRKDGKFTDKYYLDYDQLEIYDEYMIFSEPLTENEELEFSNLIDSKSGTVVTIDKCTYERQKSMNSILSDLKRELGVVYEGFLTKAKNPLGITIRQVASEVEDYSVKPFDILFFNEAMSEYDSEDYDGVRPCKVLDEEIELAGVNSKIKIEAVAFPKDGMKVNPSLSPAERALVKSYKVSRANMGFFIYRNGRLVRWGDRLRCINNKFIISKDAYGLRIKLSINSEHDDSLHVDVSKQRISVPEDLEKSLRIMLREPKAIAREIFDKCEELLKATIEDEKDGAAFSFLSQDLSEEDPEFALSPPDKKMVDRRKEKLTEAVESTEGEEDEVAFEDEKVFRKVRYSSKVKGNQLYEIGFNTDEGTFIRVNENHYFNFVVLSQLKSNSSAKQILEAMMFCRGVAESLTYRHFADVDDDVMEKVLKKLNTLYSSHLDQWCQLNPTICDDLD
ncbi:ATP-binding protein [Maridesulfovibrio sp.]|uniref:ATP-binding protein n=1 Tax=Maridesulfovibrio sp. TaxID=2795000 RepID=UPI0029F4C25A|nr:ATP-binding protein [Maridesulfovibrio sp.]